MELFEQSDKQMSRGELAALEGILTQCDPGLSIEIGSCDGPGLRRLAHHSAEVHALDRAPPPPDSAEPLTNVCFHTGPPHELLPGILAELADAGRNVDFVLLDGNRSLDAVRASLELLLDSPALARTVILVHGLSEPRVRRGFDLVRFAAWPKVALLEADLVPGRMLAQEPHELQGGLGLVLIDAGALRYDAGPITERSVLSTAALLSEVRDYVIARERAHGPGAAYSGVPLDRSQARVIELLREELAHAEHEIQRLRSVARHHEELWRSMMDSWSWRLTLPIRAVKGRRRDGGG